MPQKANRLRGFGPPGKGETVREELTSRPGDRSGSANPIGSKAKQEEDRNVFRDGAARGGPPRTRFRVGCSRPRAIWVLEKWSPSAASRGGHRTRLTGPLQFASPRERSHAVGTMRALADRVRGLTAGRLSPSSVQAEGREASGAVKRTLRRSWPRPTPYGVGLVRGQDAVALARSPASSRCSCSSRSFMSLEMQSALMLTCICFASVLRV